MALVRMTEKKLAANRANAKKSKGPTTPAGKEKVSRNACRHHLCARKHLLPPTWDARYLSFSQPLVDSRPDRDDPAVRAAATRFVHLTLWFAEEATIQTRRINVYLALHPGNARLGIARCIQEDPIFRRQAITLRRIGQEIDRTLRALKACRTNTKRLTSTPYLTENTNEAPPQTDEMYFVKLRLVA